MTCGSVLTLVFLLATAFGWTSSAWALGPCPADVNGDGEVTPADFGAWVAAYNTNNIAADQNGNGVVEPSDFSAWVANYNQPCPSTGIAELWQGGSSSGPQPIFARDAIARQPDGTDVGPNEPRYGEAVLRVPLAVVSPVFTNANLASQHLGAGYASDGTLVQFNRLRDGASPASVFQATHGTAVTGDPTQPPPANARRYNLFMQGASTAGDLITRPVPDDRIDPSAGAYFQDAYVVASTARRDGTTTKTGVVISVGNYTPAGGLSGNGGSGDRLDTIFADIEARTTVLNHVREWSVLVFVLEENEAVFNIVDYTGGADNDSWAIMVRATRSASGAPWTFGKPCVVFSKTDDNRVDHFHHMGSALQSEAGVTPGALSQFASTGDVIGDQAMYVRTIHAPSEYDAAYAMHRYGSQVMNIAFADIPSPNSFMTRLEDYEFVGGTSSWTPERTIYGRRIEDNPGTEFPWGAPQLVGCAPGPKRSQLILGADRTLSHGIFCYDVDTFDPETESPYPTIWQRWGNTSQFGVAVGDNGQSGLMSFRIHTPTPDRPEWYVADFSHTNLNGARTPDTVLLGRATDDARVVFAKIAQKLPTQTFAMTDDGRTIFCGGPGGARRIDLSSEPSIVRPQLLGAGYAQYQPLFAAGSSILPADAQAGANQSKNTEMLDLEHRVGTVARFATDADLALLENQGYIPPGLGPVYFVDSVGTANDAYYLSADGSRTLPLRALFPRSTEPDIDASFAPVNGQAELLFAVLPLTPGTPRIMPFRFSLGDTDGVNLGMPGLDYNNISLEGCDWTVFRTNWLDTDIGSLSLRVSASNSVLPGQVPARFFLQVIALTAQNPSAYPMGYHGPPYTAATDPQADAIPGSTVLPDETLSIAGPGPAGTVVYHCANDPHGVDIEYYRKINNQGISADHILLSVREDDENYIEVGWKNGNLLIVNSSTTGAGPSQQLLNNGAALQRQDDIKIVVRYGDTTPRVYIWHNGALTIAASTTQTPIFTNPQVRLGSQADGKSLPVMAFSLSTVDRVLTDSEVIEGLKDLSLLGNSP